MSDTLVVSEIYLSLQGESTFAGLPCVFVRLTACNLRCSYCDTAYAFAGGNRMSVRDVCRGVTKLGELYSQAQTAAVQESKLNAVHAPNKPSRHNGFNLPLVEVTGGEPLLQHNAVPLLTALCDEGHTVLLETSGALDISPVDPRVRRIMDLKCPSSGEVDRNRWDNLAHLVSTDEIKFVIGTREDYEWMKRQIVERRLESICPLLVSWVHPLAPDQHHPSLNQAPAGHRPISRQELAEGIIADALSVRFQMQLHKVIWPPEQRGV